MNIAGNRRRAGYKRLARNALKTARKSRKQAQRIGKNAGSRDRDVRDIGALVKRMRNRSRGSFLGKKS